MGDALRSLARQVGLHLIQLTFVERERASMFMTIRTQLDHGMVELPPVKEMRTDLLHVKKVPTPSGIGVKLPRTSDGRHCDWAPTLMLVLSRILPDPDPPKEQTEDDETKQLRKRVLERFRKNEDW